MKLVFSITILLFTFLNVQSQQKNFIDQPYIEVKASADTLVSPDRIYLDITISEEDTKGRSSVEELEQKMISELKKLSIDLEEQLFVADASSNFKSYFLSGQKVLKTKQYNLLVYKASTLGDVIKSLQDIGIANVNLGKTDHSKMEEFKTQMKAKAVTKAKQSAEAMTNAIDQRLGRAIFISETNSFAYALQGKASGMQIRGMSSMDEESSPNLSFDQFEINSEVLVRFILE
ncbi:SIMPL domain-containing protein [Psychroflexus sp. CAK8W]|uniref:SIMPL domain-containing protein n=1 Tax=Psychroflexus longus TaxID=2873596 RepID=A0ABS7XKH9_9FLAO|nr:SIMPL domain-containing protein [Psychroflexus longus]MBZ9779483.1 SIMPL domain-containing protein [Psychroflexus longus]